VNLSAVLVTGLFAGGVSYAAVQGGLLTGLITRQRAATAEPDTPPRRAKGSTRHTGNTKTRAGKQAVQTIERPNWRAQLGDDLAPVGGFLTGKLVSHTLLGALLGALGGAVELSVGARTWLQIGAGPSRRSRRPRWRMRWWRCRSWRRGGGCRDSGSTTTAARVGSRLPPTCSAPGGECQAGTSRSLPLCSAHTA
jgi:hypothetical protein